MINIVGSILTSFIVSVFVFPVLIKYSQKKKIWDEPGRRKIHKRVTPSIGGVAIFIGFFTTGLIWIEGDNWSDLKIVYGILLITFILGLSDDLIHLKPTTKLLAQVMAGSLAFFVLKIQLDSFYFFFTDVTLNPLLSYLLTIFVIIIITNAYNLIDGIDGLAGTFAGTAFLFFGIWFFLIGNHLYSIFCFSFLGALIGFLIFNWEPSKIFMGDTGALPIGMMLSIVAIFFINTNDDLPADSSYKFYGSLSSAMAVLIIPILDTSRVITLRLSKGISPLKPDKRHIHHSLVRLGLTHRQSVMLLFGIHVMFILMAVSLRKFEDIQLIGLILVAMIIINLLLNYFLGRIIR